MRSFLEFVETLLREPGERAAYLADPSGYLPAHGFGDFTNDDVELSLQFVADALSPALAALIDPAEGLESVVEVDIDQAIELLADAVDEPSGLVDIIGDDDPFLDDDSGLDFEDEHDDSGGDQGDDDPRGDEGGDDRLAEALNQEQGERVGLEMAGDDLAVESTVAAQPGTTESLEEAATPSIDDGFEHDEFAMNGNDLDGARFGDAPFDDALTETSADIFE